MSNPFAGASYLLRGYKLLFKSGIRRYVVIPVCINSLLFALLIGFGAIQFNDFVQWILPDLPEWLQWLSWLMWIVFVLLGLLILFFLFSLFCNLIAAPFNALLAQAIETYLMGEVPTKAKSKQQIMRDAMAIIVNELYKIRYFILWSIPLFILFFIPVINIVAPFLWFGFTAWMFALEYTDYPMGNHEILFQDQRQHLSKARLRTLGFGSAVSVVTMIPLVNFLVMPAAVAGATIYWVENLRNNSEILTVAE
jgi:CysZ protein